MARWKTLPNGCKRLGKVTCSLAHFHVNRSLYLLCPQSHTHTGTLVSASWTAFSSKLIGKRKTTGGFSVNWAFDNTTKNTFFWSCWSRTFITNWRCQGLSVLNLPERWSICLWTHHLQVLHFQRLHSHDVMDSLVCCKRDSCFCHLLPLPFWYDSVW